MLAFLAYPSMCAHMQVYMHEGKLHLVDMSLMYDHSESASSP